MTILGMSIVDAYKIYYIENDIADKEGLQSFLNAAAVSLLTNELAGSRDFVSVGCT